jgi:transposase-like protein
MDTYTQPVALKRRYRDIEEKRQIVEEALLPGASVARVAQRHGVNANLVFNWRKLYLAGQLCGRQMSVAEQVGLSDCAGHKPQHHEWQ